MDRAALIRQLLQCTSPANIIATLLEEQLDPANSVDDAQKVYVPVCCAGTDQGALSPEEWADFLVNGTDRCTGAWDDALTACLDTINDEYYA